MRFAAFVAVAIAAVPGVGSGQWRARPMVLPAPAGAEVLLGRFSAPIPGDEILTVDRATGAGVLHAHRALLSRSAWPWAFPASTALRAGRIRDAGTDLLADVGYSIATGVHVVYGAQPGTPDLVWGTGGLPSFARGLPGDGSVLVYPSLDFGLGRGSVWMWDFAAGVQGAFWFVDGVAPLEAGEHEVFGLRLSVAAQALLTEDLALPTSGGVIVVANRPATADLRYGVSPARPGDLRMTAVTVGGPSAEARPPWLPASIERKGDVLGAAALEVDGDGVPDLLFSYGSTLDVPDGRGGFVSGRLVSVRGTGDPFDLAWPAGIWQDITDRADIQPMRDPVTLRQVTVNGAAAAAVWDRDLDQVIVISREAGGGGLRTWRGDAAGRRVRDIRLADVVGSPAADLVVVAEDVLVYPDVGNASPVLSWSPGSPGAPVRGTDHLLSVVASDANGPVTLEWFLGDPYGVPVTTSVVPAATVETVVLTLPSTLLCDPPPQTLAVTVRATDGLGVFDELSAALDVVFPPPALALSGSPGGRLVLPPGGTSATFDGSSPGGCGPSVAFTWGGTLFDAGPPFVEDATPTTTRRTVDLPESSYPGLLAAPDPDVTLLATDGGVGSPLASLVLALDAGGLVEVEHASDVAAIAPGEVALLRTVLRNRLGVPLPGVTVRGLLAGLAPAGPPSVTGASIAGASGADVLLAELPGGGAEVVVEMPVRSTGGRGVSSVEARSSGGHLISPPARRGSGLPLPGCGCGSSGAGAGLALLVGLLAAHRRGSRRRGDPTAGRIT